MKAAVFSDTHTNTARMVEAVRRSRPDVILHLGDHDRDTEILRREFPGIPVYGVRGNCDGASDTPLRAVVPLGPVKAFLTHGHLYNVHYGRIDSLVYAAQEAGAQLALFGHTHEALYEELGGVKVLNPGTAGKGRRLTWAWIEVFDNGGVACEIRDL
ncbi:MAG: metallophosphoesterase [Oscillospiraceae bacterium]|nr:metallophosphoesterase [Oscillospiraceae bacterium]